MSASNLRESLKNQFRGAYGIRTAGVQERDDVVGIQAGQVATGATGTPAAAAPANAATQPVVPETASVHVLRQEQMASANKEQQQQSGATGEPTYNSTTLPQDQQEAAQC